MDKKPPKINDSEKLKILISAKGIARTLHKQLWTLFQINRAEGIHTYYKDLYGVDEGFHIYYREIYGVIVDYYVGEKRRNSYEEITIRRLLRRLEEQGEINIRPLQDAYDFVRDYNNYIESFD